MAISKFLVRKFNRKSGSVFTTVQEKKEKKTPPQAKQTDFPEFTRVADDPIEPAQHIGRPTACDLQRAAAS